MTESSSTHPLLPVGSYEQRSWDKRAWREAIDTALLNLSLPWQEDFSGWRRVLVCCALVRHVLVRSR